MNVARVYDFIHCISLIHTVTEADIGATAALFDEVGNALNK